MSRDRSVIHRYVVAAAVLAIVASASEAQADPAACLAAAERGQALRDRRALVQARAEFEKCAASACPPVVRTDCEVWLGRVRIDTPSIAVTVKSATGEAPRDVVLQVDGVLVARGQPRLDLDPGSHIVRAEAPGFVAAEARLSLDTSEKDRVVELTLERIKDEPRSRPIEVPREKLPPMASPWPGTIALGSAGVVGLALFGVMAATGSSELGDLRDRCHGSCDEAALDSPRAKLLIGDVALGAGIVALGAAALYWLTWPRASGASARSVGSSRMPLLRF